MRWLVVTVVAALAGCSGESPWVQKCVLNGGPREACVCLDKELKPEWRDFALEGKAQRLSSRSNMSPEAFAAFSSAMSKCLPTS